MHEYVIEGGYPIQGVVTASGNKNAALPCLAATVLTAEPVILRNTNFLSCNCKVIQH